MKLISLEFLKIKKGGNLISEINAIPSTLLDLTSLLGKTRGDPQCYKQLKVLVKVYNYSKLS